MITIRCIVAIAVIFLTACDNRAKIADFKVVENSNYTKNIEIEQSRRGEITFDAYLGDGLNLVLNFDSNNENLLKYNFAFTDIYPNTPDKNEWSNIKIEWNLDSSSANVYCNNTLQTVLILKSDNDDELSSISFDITTKELAFEAKNINYELNDSQQNKKYKIVTFGDSTTALRRTISAVYSQRLPDLLLNNGISSRVVNRGIGGSHTGTIEDNARHRIRHASERFESDVLSENPNVTVVCFGINDSYIDNEETMLSRISIDKYEANLRAIIDALIENESVIILMTPNGYSSRMKDYQDQRTKEYVEVVRKLSKEYNIALIDQWAIFESLRSEGENVDLLLLDDVHPNDKWHEKLANLLVEQIVKQLK